MNPFIERFIVWLRRPKLGRCRDCGVTSATSPDLIRSDSAYCIRHGKGEPKAPRERRRDDPKPFPFGPE
jgi:hypothetical protein